jgi:hypothetical protein
MYLKSSAMMRRGRKGARNGREGTDGVRRATAERRYVAHLVAGLARSSP